MDPSLAMRPTGTEFKASTNYFNMRLGDKVFKYRLKIDPDPPEFKNKFVNNITRQKDVSEKLAKVFKVYTVMNFTLYSSSCVDEEQEITTISDGQPVKITMTYEGELLTGERETENFLGRFFKMIQRKTGMQSIGRKYFDPLREKRFDQRGFKVWPGFSTSLSRFGNDFLVNIDVSFKVLREETVLMIMEDFKAQGVSNDEIRDKLTNSTVITKYNNKMYRVCDVRFDLDPHHEFELHKDKKKVNFLQYYQERYNMGIRDKRQPLLVYKERRRDNTEGKEIFLIPELCTVTGLSDQQRNDFNTMKELATVTKPNPFERIGQAQGLLKRFHTEQASKKIIQEWNFKFDDSPFIVEGCKIDPGNYVMAENQPNVRSNIRIEGCTDLERKIQQPMYSQPSIKKWAVFCPSREAQCIGTLMKNFGDARETFKYDITKPREVEFNDNSWRELEGALGILDPTVDAALFILAGGKKNGKFYNQVKSTLLSRLPVPSQVVLTSTLKRDKNLRTICNNVLMQMCAKLGGTPWTIDKLPFTDRPTMIVGMDVSHNPLGKKPSILSICCTVDSQFSKYWSAFKKQEAGQDLSRLIEPAFESAIKAFEATNKIKPATIIIFRDGVSDSGRKNVENVEVAALRRVFKERFSYSPKLIFVCVNKRVNTKFFVGDSLKRGDLANPNPGSIFFKKITTDKDFYLVSHNTRQGAATPSHYYVLINDFDEFDAEDEEKIKQNERRVNMEVMRNIQVLSFKLCYMYYNTVGSIKVPAPIQYAHRLNELVGDKLAKDNITPHDHLANIKSLYFI